VVIGYDLWRQYFNGDAEVVGKNVRLNRRTFTIIGVAPVGFTGLFGGQQYELWIPTMMSGIDHTGEPCPRDFRAFDLVARRAEGRTLEGNRNAAPRPREERTASYSCTNATARSSPTERRNPRG